MNEQLVKLVNAVNLLGDAKDIGTYAGRLASFFCAVENMIQMPSAVPVAQKPFFYGIQDQDGNPHFSESCIGECEGDLAGELDTLNSDYPEGEERFGIVALYTRPSLQIPEGWQPIETAPKEINGCFRQAAKALRYLAENERPAYGQSNFNSEHLLQIADEIERSTAQRSEAQP